jgi:hypothetical protein
VGEDTLSYGRLLQLGWKQDPSKGVVSRDFSSVSFCLNRDDRTVCVQGYGRTLKDAIADATHEANEWLRRNFNEQSLPQ